MHGIIYMGPGDRKVPTGRFSETIRSARLELSPSPRLESCCGGYLPWMSEGLSCFVLLQRHVLIFSLSETTTIDNRFSFSFMQTTIRIRDTVSCIF